MKRRLPERKFGSWPARVRDQANRIRERLPDEQTDRAMLEIDHRRKVGAREQPQAVESAAPEHPEAPEEARASEDLRLRRFAD